MNNIETGGSIILPTSIMMNPEFLPVPGFRTGKKRFHLRHFEYLFLRYGIDE